MCFVSLTLFSFLSFFFSSSSLQSVQVRITDYNQSALNYLWALTMHIQSLEIM